MTPEEAREAIAEKRRLSVFFTDSPLARRMTRTQSSARANLLLPGDEEEYWMLTGNPVHLPRGAYELPTFGRDQQAVAALYLAKRAGVPPPSGLGLLRVVVEKDGVRYMLHERAGVFAEASPARGLPLGSTIELWHPPAPLPIEAKKVESQSEFILRTLREHEFDPMKLPRQRKEGPKQIAWLAAEKNAHLFPGRKAFEHVWEALTRSETICYVPR